MGTVREITYDVLRNLGMNVIFGNPGSSELPFLREMPSDFRYILALHERSAAGMALGYAIARRNAAFVNLHSIASAGNGLSSLVDAYYCHVPLVVTTGQQDRRQILAEPFLVSRAVETVKPYVKWACEPLRAEDVPAAIARGYYLAMQPPRGPVFISIPMDDWNKPCKPLAVRRLSRTMPPDQTALDEVVEAIQSGSRLAIVSGSQIEEDEAWEEVIALAEHLNADVYDEPIPSRWAFPRSHPLFHGALPPAQKPLADQLSRYDTVLVVGAPVFLYYAFVPGDVIKPGTNLFQLTNSPLDASSALAGTSIVGNIRTAADYIRSRIKPRQRNVPALQKHERASLKPEHPITTDYLFSVLGKIQPPDAVISEECPSSKGDLDRHILLDQPNSFYSSRSGILGFGFPLAIGLQLANPNRRVICAVGDGSAQYSIQALWSAAHYNVPVIFIAICNGNYSALKGFQNFTGVGPNVPGMDIPGIDMVKIAQGYGLTARKIERAEDLESAFQDAFAHKKPCLISVAVRPAAEKCMGMDQSVNPPNYG